MESMKVTRLVMDIKDSTRSHLPIKVFWGLSEVAWRLQEAAREFRKVNPSLLRMKLSSIQGCTIRKLFDINTGA